MEVFNDLDSGVVNFFRVLRDPIQAEQLIHLLLLTPYSYEEYHHCLKHWQETADPVEKARAWYCGVVQSMNSSIRNTGWSHTKVPGSNPAVSWLRGIAHLAECVERLSHVQIDHRDFEKVLHSYDSPETCFYLDPPYLPDTRRKQHCYQHEMRREDHERMLSCVSQVQGMVILSGYRHALYDRVLRGWECLELVQACPSTARADTSTDTRVECIWRNPACLARAPRWTQPTLFA
jgi:DNA adenine methylase